MIIFYLVGVIISTYIAYKLFQYEWTFITGAEMILGMGLWSWLTVVLFIIYIKMHYKSESIKLYNTLLMQKCSLLQNDSAVA